MKRVITGLVLLPTFLYIILWAPHWAFLLAVATVGVLCYYEFSGFVSNHNFPPPGVFGYVAGLLILVLPRPDLSFIVLIALLALALSLASRELTDALPFASALLLGLMYVFGPLRTALDLRHMDHYWLLFAISINWVGDIAAFYCGRTFGRHKLAPRISPGKSWEGAIASLLFSLLYTSVYFPHLLRNVPLLWALGIAAAANIAGQIGDLCESAIKRGAGLKDSGTMLPGHGGWLDRIDSSLFSIPVVYFLANAVGAAHVRP